mmetsp:Transcript_11066/g.15401  ORF Transcript_11066/g.15401 Transcript_11066/m.15401 type:complete len:203 (+) Transcript_11066:39-647(+)
MHFYHSFSKYLNYSLMTTLLISNKLSCMKICLNTIYSIKNFLNMFISYFSKMEFYIILISDTLQSLVLYSSWCLPLYKLSNLTSNFICFYLNITEIAIKTLILLFCIHNYTKTFIMLLRIFIFLYYSTWTYLVNLKPTYNHQLNIHFNTINRITRGFTLQTIVQRMFYIFPFKYYCLVNYSFDYTFLVKWKKVKHINQIVFI